MQPTDFAWYLLISFKKNNGQCLTKAIPLATMKNSLRKSVNSALCSGSQAVSLTMLYMGTTEALKFSPVHAQPSSCCSGAPWWTGILEPAKPGVLGR